MAAIPTDLVIEQGAVFSFAFTVRDGVEDEDGNWTPGGPRDLTGYSGRMQIRKKQGAPVQLEATSDAGHIVFGDGADPVNGRCRITLPASLTDQLLTKAGVWDFEIVPPGDAERVERLLAGVVTVSPNITQAGTPEEKVLKP